jgi:hypothetical protein
VPNSAPAYMKNDVNQDTPADSVAGFPCPGCKAPIRFPLQALLMQSSITCPQCGLELKIDLENSAATLEDLRRYINGMEDARRILKAGMPES